MSVWQASRETNVCACVRAKAANAAERAALPPPSLPSERHSARAPPPVSRLDAQPEKNCDDLHKHTISTRSIKALLQYASQNQARVSSCSSSAADASTHLCGGSAVRSVNVATPGL